MPYKAQKAPGDSEAWEVVNTDTDEVRATHEPPDAQEKAERQVKLLHSVEKEWPEEDEDDE